MAGSLNWMPYCSRHLVRHLFVDRSRDKSIILVKSISAP
jgi:2-keto-4-pentenoate hydratase/2-oxohepta-3-ene-1,7-dioic acid hydratase in catechol pathway